MTRSAVISDEVWSVIEPVLPSDVGRRGKRWADHRRVLEGIVWRFRVGAPWRDLPADFGPWQTVWKRHYRWSTDGTYAKMFLCVQEAFGSSDSAAATLVNVISVDSTSIRAHQPAAGARNDVLTAAAITGGRPNYTVVRCEPDDHALGRSRGGWTTKIHALVDRVLRPVG